MAKKKYQLTTFARFVIFLIIALPIIYLVASYVNGEDGISTIKDKLGLDKTVEERIEMKKDEILEHQADIKELEREIEELESVK